MKKQLNITVILILIFSIQSFGQIKFEPQLYGNFGYENNIFRAPDILELRDGSILNKTDLIVSDSYLDLGYDLYFKYKIKRRHILRLNHDLWNRKYSNNTPLNQFKTNARFNYEYKISRDFQVGLKYRFDRADKIGTSVLGDELTQLFSYRKNNFGLYLKYDIFQNTQIDLSADYILKKYDTAIGVIPLNYDNLEFGFDLGQKIRTKAMAVKLDLKLSYLQKNFTDIIASDVNGKELIGYPLRIWNYYSGQFSVNGKLKNGMEFKPYISYRIRKDLFEDYYSYNALSYGILLRYMSEKLSISLSPEYQRLDYLVKIAPDPTITEDPLLVYSTFNVKFKTGYQIYDGITLSVEFNKKTRETNTLDFGWKTRRSYDYYEIMGGISINPIILFKRRK